MEFSVKVQKKNTAKLRGRYDCCLKEKPTAPPPILSHTINAQSKSQVGIQWYGWHGVDSRVDLCISLGGKFFTK